MTDLRKAASHVTPSPRQINFMRQPFYAFVHFSPNTYTQKEWGDGTEDPNVFCPEALDCDQWVEAIKSAGMTGMVLTAKHHDGFCLWPSKYTKHSIQYSKWRGGEGDIVKEASEACRRGGIRFGFYLSPWDRNSPYYGTDAYNDYYKAQLTELLTSYGEIFYVWFDGACGEGPNGKKQVYDFEGYIDLIRKYQPNACIFNDAGPDIRWIGNESGTARSEEWAVVPHELCFRTPPQVTLNPEGNLEGIYNTWNDLGSESIIRHSRGLVCCPAEVDMSIRKGWFYHPEEEPHSVERLLQTYLTSALANATFNLNIPPMPNGRFDDRDVKRLAELGSAVKALYADEITDQAVIERKDSEGNQCVFTVRLPKTTGANRILLQEDMNLGQRIERFCISSVDEYGNKNCVYTGTTVGFAKMCVFPRSNKYSHLEIKILSARNDVEMSSMRFFA